jgi:tellurite resistance protein TerC
VEVFEIGTGLSLSVIIGVLVITVIASLVSPKGRRMAAEASERRRVAEAAGADVDATH